MYFGERDPEKTLLLRRNPRSGAGHVEEDLPECFKAPILGGQPDRVQGEPAQLLRGPLPRRCQVQELLLQHHQGVLRDAPEDVPAE